ncbi:hypothetical protein [Algicola sagamiensis]|uniref:hypothetical protein n=1 Tax=Algicola sagamiensis TaxID=163869 RepID=UPI001B7FB8B2|nr:hypothetical protein [Algicola sagamiensis]
MNMNRILNVAFLITLLLLFGCAAKLPAEPEGTAHIVISKEDPPNYCKELGPVEAQHGSGCVGFQTGTYVGAYRILKSQAKSLQANYVRMDAHQFPGQDAHCSSFAYVIRGVAFMCEIPKAQKIEQPVVKTKEKSFLF